MAEARSRDRPERWRGLDRAQDPREFHKDVPARLDYCFVSAGLKDRIRGVRVDSDAVGSDHQPVWMDIEP